MGQDDASDGHREERPYHHQSDGIERAAREGTRLYDWTGSSLSPSGARDVRTGRIGEETDRAHG